MLRLSDRQIVRASVDGFHNPRAIRYRLGKTSPVGFFQDSYNYTKLKEVLLDPLSLGGSNNYLTGVFDHRTDSEVSLPRQIADSKAILVFDGIFLHRDELLNYWDYSIFLNVDFTISIPRCAERDNCFSDIEAESKSDI